MKDDHQPLSFSHRKGIYERYFKRPMDILGAITALVFLSPLFVVIAVMVRLRLGSPVIFTQRRPGIHGTVFSLYKFRTMTDDRDEKFV